MSSTTDGFEQVEVRPSLQAYDVPPRFSVQHVSVLLRGLESSRWLPIWMSKEEAFAVRAAATKTTFPMPNIEPPLWPIVEAASGSVERVALTEASSFNYQAEIQLRIGGKDSTVASSPASALLLALRAEVPIYVAEEAFSESGTGLAVITGRVRIAETGRATVEPNAPFGPAKTSTSVAIDEIAVAAFGLADGDEIKSRIGVSPDGDAPDGGYRVSGPDVITVNDEPPVLLHDVPAVGTPLRLAVPNGWIAVAPGGYVPRDSTSMDVAVWGGSIGASSIPASEVPARIAEELGGAVRRLDDSDFTLGGGFEASLRIRARRDVQVPLNDQRLSAGMVLSAGTTAQLMIGVRAGHPVVVSLAAPDWEQWGWLTAVISRSTLLSGETDAGELTEREIEVLRHIADGATNMQIAERLEISEHTVANHVRSILLKLEAANRTQAASYGFARGILEGVLTA